MNSFIFVLKYLVTTLKINYMSIKKSFKMLILYNSVHLKGLEAMTTQQQSVHLTPNVTSVPVILKTTGPEQGDQTSQS